MKSKLKTQAGPAGEVTFNMVPMVDVAFLLILFFILTSQVASATFKAMQLAQPLKSTAEKPERGESPGRVVINVVSLVNPNEKSEQQTFVSPAAKEYNVNGTPVPLGSVDALVREIQARQSLAVTTHGVKKEDFFVEIRADKRVAYEHVAPVLVAARTAGIAKVKLTAMTDNGR
jgi:biopolymer transport protein ExbD